MKNVDTNEKEMLDVESRKLAKVEEPSEKNTFFSTLLVKDKYGISNAAYHELSMVNPQLPKSSQVQKLIRDINSQMLITNTPNNTKGVQLNLSQCVKVCLSYLVPSTNSTSTTVCGKLTGDGTLVARGLNVVIFAFSNLLSGKPSHRNIKTSESYKTLSEGLQDIIQQAQNLKTINVNES